MSYILVGNISQLLQFQLFPEASGQSEDSSVKDVELQK